MHENSKVRERKQAMFCFKNTCSNLVDKNTVKKYLIKHTKKHHNMIDINISIKLYHMYFYTYLTNKTINI